VTDENSRSSPHDRLVRHTLAMPDNARGELRAALPAPIVERIDWDSLRVENGVFADQRGESRTDLLFSVELDGRTAHIYVLFEHQSSAQPDMTLRMLAYIARIWEWARGQRGPGEKLPVILPVVLSHDARGWTAERRLGDLLDWDEDLRAVLEAYVPDYRIVVDDLVAAREVELLRRDATPLTRLVIWVLRASRVGADHDLIDDWAAQLDEAHASAPPQALAHVLDYLSGTDEGAAILEALWNARLSKGARQMLKGLQRQWKQEGLVEGRMEGLVEGRMEGLVEGRMEGLVEGRMEGLVEGRAELLLNLLERRFGPMAADTGARVRGASVEQLDRWAERLLDAETLDDVWA